MDRRVIAKLKTKHFSILSPKFFLVIKVIDEKVMLANLPSSQVHLPASQSILHGCLEIPDSGINCVTPLSPYHVWDYNPV